MRTARFDAAVAAALDEAARRRLVLIARFQDLRSRSLVVGAGDPDRARSARTIGVGVQVFTEEGWCGFAATDDCSPGAVRDLVQRAGELARASGPLEPATTRAAFDLPPGGRLVVPRRVPERAATVGEELAALRGANGALGDDGLAVRTRCSLVDDEWRIVRGDGTDVSFTLSHAHLRHELTVRAESIAAGASLWSGGSGVLFDAGALALLERRARRALRRARDTLAAPAVPLGSYKVAIDAGLAKGLAHEAIGHACETDVAPVSVLASDGRLRVGDRVGPDHLSIRDEPIAGDPADQPISANGLVRQPVEIVRHGVLAGGLGDLFSAARAGVPVTGACRVGNYRQRPSPRMTNTRIVVDRPLPLVRDDDDPADAPEPEEVAAALRSAGLWRAGEPMLYLAGYRGGQAHPSRGDFVFACGATYDLADGGAPRRAALFSGRSQAALWSIVAGLGDLQLDTAGTCGKNGVNVTSSGGSHALLVLRADPELTVGGAA